jgi:pimeloyl-ACP methyl ester carboxylesterase
VAIQQQESLPIRLDASPAGLLERARLIDERGAGYIEVLEVDNAGEKAYVVVIPGTQPEGELGGDNPFDIAGIGEGLGYGSAEVNAAVLKALHAAGAEEGANVVAVGYSQGGIHAMNLAADERLLAEYDVKYVLTAGSPVGNIHPDAGVSSLHLEHRQDWVPGSDGAASPDARNRVTVTLTDDVRTPEGEDSGLGPGHRLGNYIEGARLVAASQDPSLVASTAVLGWVLGAGGTATATRFALTRSKPPEPQPALNQVPRPMPLPSPQPPPGGSSVQPRQPSGR